MQPVSLALFGGNFVRRTGGGMAAPSAPGPWLVAEAA